MLLNEDQRLVFENEKCKFYVNEMTKSLTDYARKEDLKGASLENCLVLLAENKKNKYRTYVILIDNEIVDDSTSFEGIACEIDLLKLVVSKNIK